jgi:hypothetical protein
MLQFSDFLILALLPFAANILNDPKQKRNLLPLYLHLPLHLGKFEILTVIVLPELLYFLLELENLILVVLQFLVLLVVDDHIIVLLRHTYLNEINYK